MKKHAPIYPGEILLHDFLEPLGMSQYRLSKETGLSAIKVSEIVRGKRAITAETAIRLAKYFCTSAEWWMNMQAFYDLEVTRDLLEKKINKEITPLKREAA